MSNPKTTPPLDGPPVMSYHLALLAETGVAEDSPSMRNAQITIARLSTYASARVYAAHLARFFAFMNSQGREPIDADHDDVDMFLMNTRHMAPATQSCIFGILSAYFKRAVERQVRPYNPFTGRKRPSSDPLTPTPALTFDQAQSLLDSIADDFGHPDRDLIGRRDYALVALMLFLCLRATEISDLRWKAISRSEGQLNLSFIGKGRKPATMSLPEPVYKTLLLWKSAYEGKTGTLMLPEDPIFRGVDYEGLQLARSRKGNRPLARIATRTIGRIVADRIADIELNIVSGMTAARFAAHCLRATGATLVLEAGADLLGIQGLLRHAQVDTTIAYLRRREQHSAKTIAFNRLSLAAAVDGDDDAATDPGGGTEALASIGETVDAFATQEMGGRRRQREIGASVG